MTEGAMPQESSVLRYYTSKLLLRFLASDDYDPDGASFAAYGGSDEHFLSIYDFNHAPLHQVAAGAAALLMRTPSVVVLPAPRKEDARISRGVFTVIPAEGFVKEPGQPVYYNDPITLMDQKGRMLGIVPKGTHVGHLAADGHSGALVLVPERHKSRAQTIGNKFMRREQSLRSSFIGGDAPSKEEVLMMNQPPPRSAPVEIRGGDKLRIPGLTKVLKKQFPGGSIMQHQLYTDSTSRSSIIDEEAPFLMCEVVLASTQSNGTAMAIPQGVPRPPKSNNKKDFSYADRTATGEFVGVLCSGLLHRRTDHIKIWKKRFFVLTQVALHRFEPNETMETIKGQKSRGAILIKDCRGVRYERFSRPHELEIELNSGKLFCLHAVDALTCAKWASILSRAIENPQWVHSDSFMTVWRSDEQFDSPRCPQITKVVLRSGQSVSFTHSGTHSSVISEQPRWSEKLSLGSISANGFVGVHLSDGSMFRLSLEDLSKSLLHPTWVAVSTSLDVAKIQSLDGSGNVPDNLSDDIPSHKSDSLSEHETSRFLVRLKFQADLQLDRRLTKRRSHEEEVRMALMLLAGQTIIPGVLYGYGESLHPTARSICVVSTILLGIAFVILAPVAWHTYLWLRYDDSLHAELHWFLTLLAVEVRPQLEESERMSSSSGEDSRSRFESFNLNEQDEDMTESAIVVPSRTLSFDNPREDSSSLVLTPQAIRTFRLENALDSILGRPQLSFYAIKKHFPTRFLPRDAEGRRVLLISLNAIDTKGLAAHNISGYNIARYFLYLYEYIWSYQDFHEDAAFSQLVLILDCRHLKYYQWFGVECQLMFHILNTLPRYYPGRLAKLVIVRDDNFVGLYGRLLVHCLDPSLRALMERVSSFDGICSTDNVDKMSSDETALHEFVNNILAAYANVTIPTFTRRELEQAGRLARIGSLVDSSADSKASDTIGTRAVLVPDDIETSTWKEVQREDNYVVYRKFSSEEEAPDAKGKTYQSDSQVGQWRGSYKLKSTDPDAVLDLLRDPTRAHRWMQSDDYLVRLDKLSRQEDICFWSRRVPFMSFSLSGHRENPSAQKQTNAFFSTVLRRIHDVRRGENPNDRVYTIMWKTTSAQPVIVNCPKMNNDQQQGMLQWRKLEDPYISMCFVIDQKAGSKELTLSFWFQSFAPPSTPQQTKEIAKLLMTKFRMMDEDALKTQALTKP